MPTDIFLSYSREDRAVARRYAEAFERVGLSVWWDQQLRAGEAFDEVIEQAVTDARAVVVLWSSHAVVSRWVRAEAALADDKGTLVPVQIEACAVPIKFRLTQTADLSGWSGNTADPRWQMLVASVRRFVESPTPRSTPGEPRAHSTPAGPLPAHLRPAWFIPGIVAGLLAVVGLAWYAGRAGRAEAESAGQGIAVPTLAVLPFSDLSTAKDQDAFSDGLTEEILNSLARIPGLQVTGRTSSFYFKGRVENLKTIGETLGVAYLLEGSVRKDGERLRITAQLIKAADDFHIWSQTYDRTSQDIFNIQEDIARSVAEAMQVALGVGALGVAPGMTRNVQAYEAFLKALPEFRKLTLEGYQAAAEQLGIAIQHDPMFLGAWTARWDAYMNAWLLAGVNTRLRESLLAQANVTRTEVAMRFAEVPEAKHFLSGTGSLADGGWIQIALDDLERVRQPALPLSPVARDVQAAAGTALLRLDKAREAIPLLEQRRLQDPLSPFVVVYLPEAYANAGRSEEAFAANDRAWKLSPSELVAANGLLIALGAGDKRRSEIGWDRVHSVFAKESLPQVLHSLRGRPSELRAELHRWARLQERGPSSQLALFAAAFGDPELALEILQQDEDQMRRTITVVALWRPVMRDVRRLPGFKDLVRKWGLVDYWKQHGWGEHCKPDGIDDFVCD